EGISLPGSAQSEREGVTERYVSPRPNESPMQHTVRKITWQAEIGEKREWNDSFGASCSLPPSDPVDLLDLQRLRPFRGAGQGPSIAALRAGAGLPGAAWRVAHLLAAARAAGDRTPGP